MTTDRRDTKPLPTEWDQDVNRQAGAMDLGNEFFRELAERTVNTVLLLDAGGIIVYANAAAEGLFGESPAGLVGKPFGREIPEQGAEIRIAHPKRGTVTAEVHSSRINLMRHPYDILYLRDITKLKLAQQTLQQHETFYRTILEDLPELICRWLPDGTITYVNDNYCAYFGLNREDVIGKTFVPLILEEDRQKVSRHIAALGESRPIGVIEHRTVLPNGDIRWHQWVDRCLFDGAGNLREFQSTGRDITERWQDEEQLRLSGLIVAQSSVVLFRWRVSPGWPVAYVSDNVRQWGYSPEALLSGQVSYAHIVHPDDVQRVTEELEQYLAGGVDEFLQDYRIVTRAGEPRWVEDRTTVERDAGGNAMFLQGIVGDINGRKLQELTQVERANRIRVQSEALSAVAMSPALINGDVEHFAREVTEQAARVTGVERANVWLFNEAETELRCIDLYEATPSRHSAGMLLQEAQFRNEFQVLKEAHYVDADDPLTDPRTSGYVESYLQPLRITSMLDAVVGASGKHLGLLCLEHVDRAHHWEADEIEFACRLADKIGLAITARATRQVQNQWQSSLEQAIRAMANTIEVRDPYTAGHQEHVADLAVAIARELNLSAERIQGLKLAASIHDLGKIQVPAEILNKPGKLTQIEYQLIQTHAQVGHDIIKDVHFPWPIADMILQHHERLDGSGYPQGLQAGQILLESKILAVADVVDAITSHRPYRPALGIDVGLAEIIKGKGKIYDADAVDACVKLFREKGYRLPAPAR